MFWLGAVLSKNMSLLRSFRKPWKDGVSINMPLPRSWSEAARVGNAEGKTRAAFAKPYAGANQQLHSESPLVARHNQVIGKYALADYGVAARIPSRVLVVTKYRHRST